MKRTTLLLIAILGMTTRMAAQEGTMDTRVMLQGFYWESCQQDNWYDLVKGKVREIKEARFDMIWLPPPSYAGEKNAGYQPKEYFTFDNSYGDVKQQRALLEALWSNGVEPIADIVINHRDGSDGWTGFKKPDWELDAIVMEDEAFYEDASQVVEKKDRAIYHEDWAIYINKSICEGNPSCGCINTDKQVKGYQTCQYNAFRDIAHANKTVRRDIMKYLLSLQALGYRGWRYDMVHGYHARWIAAYNKVTHPTFSVGEYDWGRQDESRGWVWHTATTEDDFNSCSCVFDFATQRALKDNKGQYKNWYAHGNGLGLVGDNTDGLAWKDKAVTFIENHDTGYREKDEHHTNDSFQDGWEAEQAYAYILTHPGIPCVYWKHYFQWNDNGLPAAIKALINARKVAGVHSGSQIYTQDNARKAGVYAAKIVGTKADICVRIGGDDNQWSVKTSNYEGYKVIAKGNGWKVWINSSKKEAPYNNSLGKVPDFKKPEEITIDEKWL